MQHFDFSKFSASGNDFVVVDNRFKKFLFTKAIIQKICDRNFGIGADGLVFLEDSKLYDYKMKIYNSDGSLADMCGNALLSLSKFIKEIDNKSSYIIETKRSFYQTGFLDDKVFFISKNPKIIKMNQLLNLKNEQVKVHIIDSGVLHAVLFLDEIDNIAIDEQSAEIRRNLKNDANVNFVKIKNNKVFVRVFEKGVEKETLACGTAALAISRVVKNIYNLKDPVNLFFKGGKYQIYFDNLKEQVKFIGFANCIFKGRYFLS